MFLFASQVRVDPHSPGGPGGPVAVHPGDGVSVAPADLLVLPHVSACAARPR